MLLKWDGDKKNCLQSSGDLSLQLFTNPDKKNKNLLTLSRLRRSMRHLLYFLHCIGFPFEHIYSNKHVIVMLLGALRVIVLTAAAFQCYATCSFNMPRVNRNIL